MSSGKPCGQFLIIPKWTAYPFIVAKRALLHYMRHAFCCPVYKYFFLIQNLFFFYFRLYIGRKKQPLADHNDPPFPLTRRECDAKQNVTYLPFLLIKLIGNNKLVAELLLILHWFYYFKLIMLSYADILVFTAKRIDALQDMNPKLRLF